jgi:predicted transcriptional regulator
VGLKRSRLDIIAAILTVATNDWTGITKILYGANLDFRQLKQYIAFLVRKELLRTSKTDRGTYYMTTSRGINFLKEYEKLLKQLNHKEPNTRLRTSDTDD